MRDYRNYIARKQDEYGSKFDPSDLAVNFIKYYENGKRIEVNFKCDKTGKVFLTKRGTVGVTTGWKPVFILMLTKRSTGSPYILKPADEVVKVI